MRITAAQRTENENRIRAAMDRLLRGEVPPGGNCDIKTLSREAGVDRTAFYGRRPYAYLRAEFEHRLQQLQQSGQAPDPKAAQIDRMKTDIGKLKDRLAQADQKIAELAGFRSQALARLAAVNATQTTGRAAKASPPIRLLNRHTKSSAHGFCGDKAHICHEPDQRGHVTAGADGPARPRLRRDDPALRIPGRTRHPHRLRRSDEQGPGPADPNASAPIGQPIIPGRVEWLRTEMLRTRVAHGYCSRQLAAEACPYANICEQCDNYVTAPEFIPQLQAQLADVTALRDDAAERGWHTEVARHSRVIASIQTHLQRLKRSTETGHTS